MVIVLFAATFLEPIVQSVWEYYQYTRQERSTPWPESTSLIRNAPGIWSEMRQKAMHQAGLWRQVLAGNSVLMQHMNRWENDLKDHSLAGSTVRPPAQMLFCRIGLGNEKAYVGRDRWLFFRPEIDHLTQAPFLSDSQLKKRASSGSEVQAAPQPDPRKAIRDLAAQLKARGISLVVVPTPCKPQVHPEQFTERLRGLREPLYNASFAAFVKDLTAADIDVIDLAPEMVRQRLEGHEQFLRTDTHWRPEVMQRAAMHIAAYLREHQLIEPTPAGAATYVGAPATVSGEGDIAVMLKLPSDQDYYKPQEVPLVRVSAADGTAAVPDASGRVLLLGDSYSNIYSAGAMGWGENAGLAEHLMLALQQPVDRISRNDSGAFATRELLARELRQGRDRLAGKKVVIWQFAVRELSQGDWKIIELPQAAARPTPASNTAAVAAEETVIEATIAEATAPRDPNTVYPDYLRSVHLKEVTVRSGTLDATDVAAYVWSLRRGKEQPGYRLQTGQRVKLKLKPLAAVKREVEGINRSDLEDLDLLDRLNWLAEVQE
jgi:alginate O-acetyltransferase complex protein AlgJ